MSGAPSSPEPRISIRYYVLEVLEKTEANMRVSVVSGSYSEMIVAWRAASEMRHRHPGRVYIAGEICTEVEGIGR